MAETIHAEVVFASQARQEILTVALEPGATVTDAINRSGIRALFPDMDMDGLQAGVWGKPADRTDTVSDGDRVELYRPLVRDPQDARRELAKTQRLGSSS